jgi:gamma-glutamyltranspeptidase / glutathione hydrolase
MMLRRTTATLIVLGLIGSGQLVAQQQKSAGAPLPIPGRSIVATRQGIVAASQPLAARAGVEILERGGNAIDAAIAANAVMGLMEPTGNGIGGDLFVIYYDAKTGQTHGLNASGWAPTGLTPELVASKVVASKGGNKEMPQRGVYSVTVPGVVAGWHALREKFGTLEFNQLLAPAIYYAEEGFPLSEVTAGHWGGAGSLKLLTGHPNAAKTFLLDNGTRPPRAGEVFRNPDLGRSLRRIAEKGRDGYYTGPTADAIVAIVKEHGGTMTAADLAESR